MEKIMTLKLQHGALNCWKATWACRECTDMRLYSTLPWTWRCSVVGMNVDNLKARPKKWKKL